jgi:microcystin-dependent protein
MEPILGQLMLFAGTYAPLGWYACEGQLISISENVALFSLLGTTYGGDGMSTFALPDLRGRVPNHQGQGPGLSNYVQGQRSGSDNITLTAANTPPHTHAATATVKLACCSDDKKDQDTPVGGYPKATTDVLSYSGSANTQMGPSPFSGNLGVAGQSAPIPMAMPSIAMKYCIAYEGIFPSRP